MNRTSIAWVKNPDGSDGFTWNPFAGCAPISAGCRHCYAARLAGTRLAHMPQYAGLVSAKRGVETSIRSYRGRNKGATPQVRGTLRIVERVGHWTGEVRFFAEKLAQPLRRRKPSGIFVCDMGDLFHEAVTNEQIAAAFGVMAACPQHTFHVLTKRAGRMREWFEWAEGYQETMPTREAEKHVTPVDRAAYERLIHSLSSLVRWPLPNVRLGVTVCTRADLPKLDELREVSAALRFSTPLRFVSFEPLLEDLGKLDLRGMAWAIPGGESGPNARPCHVEWIRSIVRQCRDAGVPAFAKQLGANCRATYAKPSFREWEPLVGKGSISVWSERGKEDQLGICFRRRAGDDPREWPQDLRVRQFPRDQRGASK
jgi:protein gp37